MTTEESLWDFAVRVYGRPGVEAACVELQDSYNADVLVLIYGLWAGTRGKRLSRGDFAAIMSSVAPWQRHTISPLRAVRRALKESADFSNGFEVAARSVGRRVKDLELDAERCELEFLETLGYGEATEKGGATTESNLAIYLSSLDISPHQFGLQQRSLLVAAADRV
ncbi:MAG: TIGR02444 family protein [Alphaproteobacteria bacterium]